MSKGIKTVIAIILSVWIFVMGYEIGAYRETKNRASQTTAAQVVYQSQPTVQQPTVSDTQPTAVQPVSDTTAAVQSEQTTASQIPESTAALGSTDVEILNKVTQAVNATKAYTGAFTANCTQVRKLGITDCSVETLTNTIDGIVQKFIGGGETKTYTFANGTGTDQDGKAVTPSEVIPPRATTFSLTQSGVASAAQKASGADELCTVNLVPETASLDVLPTYNSAAAGYLDLSKLSILTSIEYSYPGTVVEATINANGLLAALHVVMPIAATGNGSVLGFEGSASFEGSLDETWTFIYS